jgi:hypothetical protein
MQTKSEARVELHGTRLPGVRFQERGAVRVGIQAGREIVDDIPADAEKAVFTATVRVTRLEDGAFDFGGPYVFGTRGDRFLYLCWGERIGGAWDGFRRAKIKLGYVPPLVWEGALGEGQPVVGRLELTDAKGGPKCASLRPDEVDWSVGRSA